MYIETFIWNYSNLARLIYEYIHSEVELYIYNLCGVEMMKTKIKREVGRDPLPLVCPCPSPLFFSAWHEG